MSNEEYISNIGTPENAVFLDGEVKTVAKDWEYLKKMEKEAFVKDRKTEILDSDLTMFSRPRKGCAHCYGTGVEGVYDETSTRQPGELKLCRCVVNKLLNHPEWTDTNIMPYGEFREMLSKAKQRYNIGETPDENECTSKVDNDPIQGIDKEVDLRGDGQ